MAQNKSTVTAFGKYLKELRTRKAVSLKDVEDATGIPNAYLSQLETGTRKKLPDPDRLRVIAQYYNASIQELLCAAGYCEPGEIVESQEAQINKKFFRAISDPSFESGHQIDINKLSLDVKKYIVDLYETKKYLRPSLENKETQHRSTDRLRYSFRWTIEDVKRFTDKDPRGLWVRYEVKIICVRITERVDFHGEEPHTEKNPEITETVEGFGTYTWRKETGPETESLNEATRRSLNNALAKFGNGDYVHIENSETMTPGKW